MTDPVTAATRPGQRQRPVLDRDKVAVAALAIIDESGVNALTMRTLAARLGVAAQSLYTHVTSRTDLLNAVVDIATEDIEKPSPRHRSLHLLPWPATFIAAARDIRSAARRHPRVFALMACPGAASTPSTAYPPFRSDSWVTALLARLVDAGMTQAQAHVTFRAFREYLIGFLLLETADLIDHQPALGDRDADFDAGLVTLLAQLAQTR